GGWSARRAAPPRHSYQPIEAPLWEPRKSFACSLRAHYRTGSKGQRQVGFPEALSQPASPRAPLSFNGEESTRHRRPHRLPKVAIVGFAAICPTNPTIAGRRG